MEIFAGMLLLAFLETLVWLGVRAWRKATAPPPVLPRSPAQRANKAAFEHIQSGTPVVHSLRVQRARRRGAQRRKVEREYDPFE